MVTDTVIEDNVSLRVSSDDAEQENDAIDGLYDDDLDAGWEGAPEDFNTLTVGLRFRDIFIPKGATIDWATEYDKELEKFFELTLNHAKKEEK